MSIKMPQAFSVVQQKIISATEYNNDTKENMLCVNELCRTNVVHIRKYERAYGDKIIKVNAYFRLKSKNYKHKKECAYNINNQVNVIARSSN